MSAIDSNFAQKWDVVISPQTQKKHSNEAFVNHMITVATVTTFVALTVIASLAFPEVATFVLIGTIFLLTPGVELARVFLNKAKEAKKLEDQTLKVRVIYNRLLAIKASNAEAQALHEHWNTKASKAQKSYDKVLQRALDKAKGESTSPALITKCRLDALDAEKEAKTIKVYELLLHTLTRDSESFKKAFLKHGENLSGAFSDFSTWDERETQFRAMDPRFTDQDNLLVFKNKKIKPISYAEVYDSKKCYKLQNRLAKALLG